MPHVLLPERISWCRLHRVFRKDSAILYGMIRDTLRSKGYHRFLELSLLVSMCVCEWMRAVFSENVLLPKKYY